jgi:hypothetical protein
VGRPAGLHGEDLRRVESQLKRGPGTLGYKKWTTARVKELIERQCRVKCDASQAWRILRRMGWSFHASGPKPGPPGTRVGGAAEVGGGKPTQAKIGLEWSTRPSQAWIGGASGGLVCVEREKQGIFPTVRRR